MQVTNSRMYFGDQGIWIFLRKFEMNIQKSLWQIRSRMKEYMSAFPESSLAIPKLRDVKWSSPPEGTIKINCDTAIGQDKAYLAIVAGDWRGTLVLVCPKEWKPTSLSKPKPKLST